MSERLIAIGDIHGCYYTLKDLMSAIEYNKDTDTVVFIGDYIDRGPHSYRTVKFLRQLQFYAGTDKVICLRGNHEQMAIDACGELRWPWVANGAEATLFNYQEVGADFDIDLSWFRSLPLVYDTPEILFCHAGLTHPKISDNIVEDVLWGREWIDRDSRPREKQVVFGHTPDSRWMQAYWTKSGDLCLDGGCVFGGKMSAAIFYDDGTPMKLVNIKRNKKDLRPEY